MRGLARNQTTADASRRALRVDLGAACVPDRWPCDVTGGRAAYFALDAMGYTAANVRGVLASPADREKLAEQVALGLVDDGLRHREGEIVFSLDVAPLTPETSLNVILSPADATRLEGRRLWLAPVDRGTVGAVTLVAQENANGHPYTLDSFIVHAMPPGTNPDPTIAGVIDFIRDDARYYQKQKGDKRASNDES
jgi:hypothetical protein